MRPGRELVDAERLFVELLEHEQLGPGEAGLLLRLGGGEAQGLDDAAERIEGLLRVGEGRGRTRCRDPIHLLTSRCARAAQASTPGAERRRRAPWSARSAQRQDHPASRAPAPRPPSAARADRISGA